jgi:spermidine synthase
MRLPRRDYRRHVALALISAALLAFQIALMQIIATSQWHHFAAFVISIALLGFGAAGTLLALARDWMVARQDQLLPLLLTACAVALSGVLWLSRALFGGFDSLLLFVAPQELLRLVTVAFLLMLPFLCGALAIGLIFTAGTERIASYYFANMLGSGLGCPLGLAGLSVLLPQQLPPLCAMLALAAAVSLPAGKRRCTTYPGMLLGVTLTAAALWHPAALPLSQYKDLSRTLELPGAAIRARHPAAAGQVHVVAAPGLRSATGVSLNWSAPLPSSAAVFVNGDMIGSLPPAPGQVDPRDASTHALPYAISRPHAVLVLDAGTGSAVRQARARGADSVVAVESHGTLAEILAASSPESFGRLLADHGVAWQETAPRTWLARDRRDYDLVILPDAGCFGGNAGLFALQEQPLLTREALGQAWQRLSPDGLLAITAWLDYPVRNPLRLTASLVEMLDAAGVHDPAGHIAAVRSWGTITFCVKRSPFTDDEVRRVRAFAARWAFDPALLPGLRAEERQAYNQLQDGTLFAALDALFDERRAALYADYAFRIRPVSDDRPFFAQFLRWDRLGTMLDLYGQRTLPFLESGLLVAGLAALVLLFLAALLILLPLTRLPPTERRCWRTLLYFAGLGFGYMWTELALVHRFVFYLGQPVYATALVVGVMLSGSAIGSGLAGLPNKLRPGFWAALVAAALLLQALLLGPLLQATLQLPFQGRITLALLAILPAAVVMGMPFPLGLRLLNRERPAHVPWAWGINGCCSVVGAAMATLLAVELGYSLLLVLAAGAYLAAVACSIGRAPQVQP